ncbi:uncharacterized protein LOC144923028 isoform X2 [Branchiostoma floridae x Branchiostoma belcheri]
MKPSQFDRYKGDVDRAYGEGLTKPNQIYNHLKQRVGSQDSRRWLLFKFFVRNRVNRVLKREVPARGSTSIRTTHKGVQTARERSSRDSASSPEWRFKVGQRVSVQKSRADIRPGKIVEKKICYVVRYDNSRIKHDELLPQEHLRPAKD